MNESNADGTAFDNLAFPPHELEQISTALAAIYSSDSSNETRKEATKFLDEVKNLPEAAALGYALAADNSRSSTFRHYGLSVLEHYIKYRSAEHSAVPAPTVRLWIIKLAQNVGDNDPPFLRKKIAQLWVEVAKRSWIEEWIDMDKMLCQLWSMSRKHQQLVIYILVSLTEQLVSKESSIPGVKGVALGRACVEIFTSSDDYAVAFPKRGCGIGVRCGNEGWLCRLTEMFTQTFGAGGNMMQPEFDLAVGGLILVQSILPWILLKSVIHSQLLARLFEALEYPNIALHLISMEALHALYHRSHFQEDEMVELVCPHFTANGVAILKRIYESYWIAEEELDYGESKYRALKKFSEVLCALGAFLEDLPRDYPAQYDIAALFNFLLEVLQNGSLVVSIPILYLWNNYLASPIIGDFWDAKRLANELLQTCCKRLFKYEALPQNSLTIGTVFLNEDFDSLPERHAFLGNYRRYCVEVIVQLVRKYPFQAIPQVLVQFDQAAADVNSMAAEFNPFTFKTISENALRLDASATAVTTALKACMGWLAEEDAKQHFYHAERISLTSKLEEWCGHLLRLESPDPVINKRILQLAVDILLMALPTGASIAMQICEQILQHPPTTAQTANSYDEAVKELEACRPKEVQRLAFAFADTFLESFDRLRMQVDSIQYLQGVEERVKLDYQAFLYIVMLHASNVTEVDRTQQIDEMLKRTLSAWQDPVLIQGLASFEFFCQMMHLDGYASFFLSCKSQNIEDWSNELLSPEGERLKATVLNQLSTLPLQATRSFLAASTDRASVGGRAHSTALSCWQTWIPDILPKVLQFIGYSQAFNNPRNWLSLPAEFNIILQRTLQDRVWQSGISYETRDDFYAKIRNSQPTLEGLASTVRRAVREVRELSYWILHCMCQLGVAFYGIADLPEPLAHALYADAHVLSAHQLTTLLKLSTAIIDGCPVTLRAQFLPPILISLFKQLDVKISADWDAVEGRNLKDADDDVLEQEMKAESILRQLTYSAVLLVAGFLNHNKQQNRRVLEEPTLRMLILSSPALLEPLILFCTHALRMRDHRCCTTVTQVLRSLIPEFRGTVATNGSNPQAPQAVEPATAAQVREFFSTAVLKACITSLNEPYFADMHKDLAALIAAILALYAPQTETPKQVLLSLPGMKEETIDNALEKIQHAGEKEQRSRVLQLLENVKGVSIHEQGRLRTRGLPSDRRQGAWFEEKFMAMDEESTGIIRGGSPEPGAIADIFG